jgi:hypothetical protein
LGDRVVRHLHAQTYLPIGYTFAINSGTLAFTLVVAVTTGVLFGLAPSLQACRLNLSGTLRKAADFGGALPHHGLRSALVVAEVALALVLLIGAGLCIKGFRKAQQADIGFDQAGVALAGLRVA